MTIDTPNHTRRRTLLAGLVAGAWCLAGAFLPAGQASAAETPTIGTVAVLGDSYSLATRSGVKGWVQQLVDRNAVSVVINARGRAPSPPRRAARSRSWAKSTPSSRRSAPTSPSSTSAPRT